MRNELVSKSTIRDEDPRAALLKYAAKSDENPVYLGESINTVASSLLSHWRINKYFSRVQADGLDVYWNPNPNPNGFAIAFSWPNHFVSAYRVVY